MNKNLKKKKIRTSNGIRDTTLNANRIESRRGEFSLWRGRGSIRYLLQEAASSI